MGKSNPRFDCKGCGHKNTRNQLKASNGICIHCKTPYPHTQWVGGQQATLGQLLTIPKADDEDLTKLADDLGVRPSDLISAAIQIKLREWQNVEDIEKAIKQDLMLTKLYRR